MAAVAISLAIGGGSMVLQYLLTPRVKQQPIEKGKLDDIRITSSDYGAFIPRVWGKGRIGGNIIFSDGVEEFIINTPSGGGKGVPQAPATRTYVYKTSIAVLIARGEIPQLLRVWADANLLTNNSSQNFGTFEAELAALSGGASIVNPDASASGGKSVTNLGSGGTAIFDFSSIPDPPTPQGGDPNEVALPYSKINLFYKCASDKVAQITTNTDGATNYTFVTTGSDWTVMTIHFSGFVDDLTFANPSGSAPDLDVITIEKYYVIETIGTFKTPTYTVTGAVNENIAYPPDLDDPSEYYNAQLTADANGKTSLTTPIPGEMVRFYQGTSDQEQDSAIIAWLDEKYGAGQGILRCPAFRDLSYIMYENRTLKQARVENFTFEVNAGNPNVNDILADLFEDVGIESGDYDITATAGLTQVGFLEHTSTSRRQLIESLERYHQFRIAEIDGKIKTILDTSTPIATISSDDLRSHNDGEEMPSFDAEVLYKDPSQFPQEVKVSVMNPAIEYHNETVPARLFSVPSAKETREYTFPIVDNIDNARLVAEKLLLKEHSESKGIEFIAMPSFAKYTPGDVVTVPIGGKSINVRIEKMQMQLPLGKVKVQAVSVSEFNPTYFQSDVTSLSPKLSQQFATYDFPRNAVAIPIISEPLNSTEKGKLGFYLAVTGRGRGSSKNFALYREIGTENYVVQNIIDVPAVAGLCAGTLATHGTPSTEDTTNTLDIWFFDNIELESQLQADLDAFPTLNLIRIGNEWVQFRTATVQTLEENSPYRSKWRISNLWRERFGTSGKAATHAADEYAVLYNQAVGFYEVNTEDIGEDINLKAVTNGQNLEVAPITTISAFTPLSAYTVTNGTTVRAFDADATDLDEVADVLATVIDDLKL